MSFSLESFQLGDIITGKIIKLEPTGVLVDFYTDQLAYVPLVELSLNEIQSPEEASLILEIYMPCYRPQKCSIHLLTIQSNSSKLITI
ncbi:hypothetical protein [Nostoc sp.]|uniref:hypothetical protein n=1 Tax=Nostoc sp. TaxID=1180 RepID=UPI002FF5074F